MHDKEDNVCNNAALILTLKNLEGDTMCPLVSYNDITMSNCGLHAWRLSINSYFPICAHKKKGKMLYTSRANFGSPMKRYITFFK